jgi:hypothetical protein
MRGRGRISCLGEYRRGSVMGESDLGLLRSCDAPVGQSLASVPQRMKRHA